MTAAMEHSHIQFGATRIPYVIRRSQKRRTVALTIVPDEGVVLTAPDAVPVDHLDRVVRAKARWIIERLRELPAQPRPAPREFISGESFNYLGRQHRLRVVERVEQLAPVRLDHGRFIVAVAPGLEPADRAVSVREQLISWFRERAGSRLRERVAFWAARMGMSEPKLALAGQQKHWGSCTAKASCF